MSLIGGAWWLAPKRQGTCIPLGSPSQLYFICYLLKGYYAAENIYSPEDFAVLLYTKLGIDPHQVLHTTTGRPVQLVNGGKLIKSCSCRRLGSIKR